MKKNSLLLLALTSGIALSACNSGSSSPTPTPTPTQGYMYNVSYSNNSIVQCALDYTTGVVSGCVSTKPIGAGALNGPAYIASEGNKTVVITNWNSVNTYTECKVSNSGLDIASCQTHKPTGAGALDGVAGIAVDVNNKYAYFVNVNGDSITQCTVGANSINIDSCVTLQPKSPGALDDPKGVVVAGGSLVITNSTSNSVTTCPISAVGLNIGGCIQTKITALNDPREIVQQNNYFTIVNYGDNSYTQCLSAGDAFNPGACTKYKPTIPGALSGPKNLVAIPGFVYIQNFDGNSMVSCTSDPTGAILLSTCAPVGSNTTSQPHGVVVIPNTI